MSKGSPRIVPVPDAVDMDVGAPVPLVVASEDVVLISYLAFDEAPCVITFTEPTAHYLGAPNDEALPGHPLYAVGLPYYSFVEVLNSEWIETLRGRNRVHSKPDDRMFDNLRHFILTFHDSTAEVVARGYSISRSSEAVDEVINALARRYPVAPRPALR